MIPFPIFYDGTAAPGVEMYRYEVSTLLVLNSYRFQFRAALSQNLKFEIYNGATLVEVFTIPSATVDTDVEELSPIQFAPGDTLSLKVAADGTIQPTNNGMDFTFFVDIEDSVPGVYSSQQIQTPLFARIDGPSSTAPDPFFTYTFSQLTEVFGFTIMSRINPVATAAIEVLKDATVVATLSFSAGTATFAAGIYFQAGEVLTLRVSSASGTEAVSLWIDYRNTTQTTFTRWQTPFLGYYEALANDDRVLGFYYNTPRPLTLAFLQVFLNAVQASIISVGLFINGTLRRTVAVPIGDRVSNVLNLSLGVATGTLVELRLLSPNVVTQDFNLTLDYYLDEITQDIVYYSDPVDDIIQQVRQLGVGSAKSDGMSITDIALYQKQVDNVLNSRLSPLYRVPLYRLQTDRSFGSPWPNPIQAIAQRLVTARILNDYYSEVEPNATGNVANNERLANSDLDSVLRKEVILDGQRLRSRNYGSDPYSEPLSPFGGNAGTSPSNPGVVG